MKKSLVIFLQLLATFTSVGQENNGVARPQEPKEPFPYFSELVTFQNQENNTLAGTLTLPKGKTKVPTVVLISGSSPHNRDQEIAGHKPFLVLADYLTRNGIGVLRYDDRGVGESEGSYEIAAYEDRANDVNGAISFLKTRKEVDKSRIGLVGHSEGGLIASIVASMSKGLGFIVTLGAPALPGREMILLQTKYGNNAKGIDSTRTQEKLVFLKHIFDDICESSDLTKTKSDLLSFFEANRSSIPSGMKIEQVSAMLETFTTSWFQTILMYDPRLTLEKVTCPVLALSGERDLQIPPKENLAAIKMALGKAKNPHVVIKELPQLNHLFQEAQTGLPDEFATIEQTFSPIALTEIVNWIRNYSE